jgi:hypothetical protein
MAKRKAAFQMSLGFIVAVVFAVVLLTLSVTWVQQLFGGVVTLTDDLTQDAHNKLQEEFRSTSKNFAVWPNRRTQGSGTTVILSAAIDNDADDGETHTYVMNVIPSAASASVCPGGDLETCSSPKTGKSLYEYMLEWVTWTTGQQNIQINTLGFWDITVDVPTDVMKGQYMFNVVSCWDRDDDGNQMVPNAAQCSPVSSNIWGGSAQPLTMVIE